MFVLVEFWLKFPFNDNFQLFLHVVLNFKPSKSRAEWLEIICSCIRAHQFFNNFDILTSTSRKCPYSIFSGN